MTPDASPFFVPVSVWRGSRRRGAWGPCARAAGPNGPRASGQAGRWRQRSVLRTDSPALLASGSCGATHFARCARFVQTRRRKSDVRSALRAPTPTLRCSAPPESPRLPARTRPVRPGRPGARAPGACGALGPHCVPPTAALAASVVTGSKTGLLSTNTTMVSADARAVRCGRALCAAEKRSSAGGARSARRPSFSRRLSERSSRKRAQRVSPRQPVLRASQGTPAKRGQAPGAPAAHGPRVCPRHASRSY